MAFRFQIQNCLFYSGTDPRAARHALTLEGEDPVVRRKAGFLRDQRGRFFRLRFILIAFGDGSLGHAVGCKNYGQPGSMFRGRFLVSGTQLLSECLREQRMIVPLLDEIQGERETPLADYCTTVDRKSTRLNSSHVSISYAVFCLKK